mgnify:FL=1
MWTLWFSVYESGAIIIWIVQWSFDTYGATFQHADYCLGNHDMLLDPKKSNTCIWKKKLKAKTDMWHMGNNLDNNLRGRFSFILGLYPAVVVWETRSFKMFIAEKWLLFDNYFWVIRSHPLCPCFFQTEVFWPWEAGVLGCFAQQARSGRHDVQLVKISQ